MQPGKIIEQLEGNRIVFQGLLGVSDAEHYLFKANPAHWNLLEIVCHLLDEEREDFRARVKSILTDPSKPLTAISPEKWPLERKYLKQDFQDSVGAFLSERDKSISWLKSLRQPNWEQAVDHPEVGPRSAKKFLVNWLAHDFQHIRQINKVNHAYLKYKSSDDLTYAGKW